MLQLQIGDRVWIIMSAIIFNAWNIFFQVSNSSIEALSEFFEWLLIEHARNILW